MENFWYKGPRSPRHCCYEVFRRNRVPSSKSPPSLTRRFSSFRLPMAAAFNQRLNSMLALILSPSFLVPATPEEIQCLVPAPMRNRSRFGSFLEKLGMRRSTRET